MEHPIKEPEQTNIEEKRSHLLKDILIVAFLTVFVVLPFRFFVAQPFIVSGLSMDPAFDNGDYLIVDQISYRFGDPQRNEVIVFRLPENEGRFLIKRIIGLPGETVNIESGEVIVQKTNGEKIKLEEPFVQYPKEDSGVYELGEEEYFVLGDNRAASSDSRMWGVLEKDLIVGRALSRLFPFSQIGFHPGYFTPTEVPLLEEVQNK